MLRTRIIPTLLLRNGSLVKTKKFRSFNYIGDPSNTARIFNELEVDEIVILDILATLNNNQPDLKSLKEIAEECFMPLSYGGGIDSLDKAKKIFDLGFEKIVLNTHAVNRPKLISEISYIYGRQAVVVSVDYRKNFFGKKKVWINSGKINSKKDLLEWVKEVEHLGAGEILLTSIDHEGTWSGYDFDTIKEISDSISIPIIANGGAGNLNHISKAIKECGASAVSLGSMVVYQKKDFGVLINFPDQKKIEEMLK
jgi:cyclase